MINEPYVPAHISPDELLHRQQADPKLLVLDVRSRSAYDRGHIAGAVSLPAADVPARWEVARGASLVVIYGELDDDPDAEWAARFLGTQGPPVVMLLEGGYRAWTEGGLPARDEMHVSPPDRGGRVMPSPTAARPAEVEFAADEEREPIGISPESPTGRVLREGADAATSAPDEQESITQFLAHGDEGEAGAA